MNPQEVVTWAEALAKAGGWGIAVIEAGVIWYLWKQLLAKDARLFALLDKTNEILLALRGNGASLPPKTGGAQ